MPSQQMYFIYTPVAREWVNVSLGVRKPSIKNLATALTKNRPTELYLKQKQACI